MNLAEKLELAHALVKLGIDVIEADSRSLRRATLRRCARSPAASGSVICGLARCREADIDRAGEALRHAERGCTSFSPPVRSTASTS